MPPVCRAQKSTDVLACLIKRKPRNARSSHDAGCRDKQTAPKHTMTRMTSSDPALGATGAQAATLALPVAPKRPGRVVTDAPMRMFHWLSALCFVGAYISADSENWQPVHVVLGYTLAGLLVWRLVYGLVGPRPARLSALWRKVSGTRAWLKAMALALKSGGLVLSAPWRQGENLLLALALVALLVMVIPLTLTLTGYATFHEWGDALGGEVFEDLHAFLGDTYLTVVLLHLALLAWLSFTRRKNQALPMLTGRIPGPGPDLVKSERRWLAALVLASVLAYWVWETVNR
jgi:cytochrome b